MTGSPKPVSTLIGVKRGVWGVGGAIDEKGISFIKRSMVLCSKMSDVQKCFNTFVLDCRCKQNKI